MLRFAGLVLGIGSWIAVAQPQSPAESVVVFRNVRVFDGTAPSLSEPVTVTIRGSLIASIGKAADAPAGATVIEGERRTLMPGLIDAHYHIVLDSLSQIDTATADIGYIHVLAVRSAQQQLLRGFTTIRDLGGPSFGLKRAIDRGLAMGPRIYPSGALISQTGGHGDFLPPTDVPRRIGGELSYLERLNVGIIADGAEQVLMRVREQLRQGASQIKLMAGGGVASPYDPLDVTQYTEAELRAGVDAAENWGTYVTVHAYTSRAIQTAIRAGVKCIDHAQLMDDATAKLMSEKGTWLSMQPFLDDEDATPFPAGSVNDLKQRQMIKGTDRAYALAKKYKLKTAWGTDILFDAKLAARENAQLVKMVRWYTPAEILTMATRTNAELLAMSGPRNPYPGKLGVVEEGALADLLLVNGDPLANIKILEDPDKTFAIIMKDGKIFKNALSK